MPFGERLLSPPSDHRAGASGFGSNASIDLDGFFGLNPRVAPLKRPGTSWLTRLCVWLADSTRSPFDARTSWNNAGCEELRRWMAESLSQARHVGQPRRFGCVLTGQVPRVLRCFGARVQPDLASLVSGRNVDRSGQLLLRSLVCFGG